MPRKTQTQKDSSPQSKVSLPGEEAETINEELMIEDDEPAVAPTLADNQVVQMVGDTEVTFTIKTN